MYQLVSRTALLGAIVALGSALLMPTACLAAQPLKQRVEAILELTGEIEVAERWIARARLAERTAQLRPEHAGAMQEAWLRLLSRDAAPRDRMAARLLAELSVADIDRLEEWAQQASREHRSLLVAHFLLQDPVTIFDPAPPMPEARKQLLVRWIVSSHLPARLPAQVNAIERFSRVTLAEAAGRSLDPNTPWEEFAMPPSAPDAILGSTARLLTEVGDDEVERYLKFAESELGTRVFAILARAFGNYVLEVEPEAVAMLRQFTGPRDEANVAQAESVRRYRELQEEQSRKREAAKLARLLVVLERTGEPERFATEAAVLAEQLKAMIRSVDREMDPAMLEEIDLRLTGTEARKRWEEAFLSAGFVGRADDARIDALEAWSVTSSSAAVHRALAQQPDPLAPEMAPIGDSRRELLRQLVGAMDFVSRLQSRNSKSLQLAASLVDAVDPLSNARDQLGRVQIPEQMAVDYLSRVLADVEDEDLVQYALFAQSAHGRAYLGQSTTAWRAFLDGHQPELVSRARELASVPAAVDDAKDVDAMLAQARYLAHEDETQGVLAETRNLLIRADRLRPDDPAILTELGLVSSRMRQRDDAKRYLERALSIEPDHPDALVYLGYQHFAEGNYVAAEERYTRAAEVGSRNRWLPANVADLRKEQGRIAEAIEGYTDVLRVAEPGSAVASNAFRRLQETSMLADRMEEFETVADAFLLGAGEARDERYAYARYLATAEAAPERIISVVGPMDSRDRSKRYILSYAHAVQSMAQAGPDGGITPPARRLLDEAIEQAGSIENLLGYLVEVQAGRPWKWVLMQSDVSAETATKHLVWAVATGEETLSQRLLEQGADVHARTPLGQSLLEHAAGTGQVGLMRLLLQQMHDPNRRRVELASLSSVIEQYLSDKQQEMLRLLSEFQ